MALVRSRLACIWREGLPRLGRNGGEWLLGRNIGFVPYFLAAALGLLVGAIRSPAQSAAPACAFLGYSLLLLLAAPDNFHGGVTSFGNRYLLVALPVLFPVFISALGGGSRSSAGRSASALHGPGWASWTLALGSALGSAFLLGRPLAELAAAPSSRPVKDHVRHACTWPLSSFPVELGHLSFIYLDHQAWTHRLGERAVLYRLDEGFHDWEERQVWLRGGRRGRLMLETFGRVGQVSLALESGERGGSYSLCLGPLVHQGRLEAGERRVWRVDLTAHLPPTEGRGRELRAYYPITLESSISFVPSPPAADGRCLALALGYPELEIEELPQRLPPPRLGDKASQPR